MDSSLAGQLLIASPALLEKNFTRTVMLICVHSEEGAMGVVLNRPSEVTVPESVPALEDAVGALEPLYCGGPVQPGSIVCLAEFLDPSASALLIVGRVGFPAAGAEIGLLDGAASRARFFAGFAGWSEGQLEAEVDNGDWIAERASAEDVFTLAPEGLWSSALTRKGGRYALLARMPVDPSVN